MGYNGISGIFYHRNQYPPPEISTPEISTPEKSGVLISQSAIFGISGVLISGGGYRNEYKKIPEMPPKKKFGAPCTQSISNSKKQWWLNFQSTMNIERSQNINLHWNDCYWLCILNETNCKINPCASSAFGIHVTEYISLRSRQSGNCATQLELMLPPPPIIFPEKILQHPYITSL